VLDMACSADHGSHGRYPRSGSDEHTNLPESVPPRKHATSMPSDHKTMSTSYSYWVGNLPIHTRLQSVIVVVRRTYPLSLMIAQSS